jgi:hypothetical protein
VVRRIRCGASQEAKAKPVSIIDGGYFDNSGLETAIELSDWLRAHGGDPIVVAVTGDGDSSLSSDQIVRCGSSTFDPMWGREQKHVWEPLGPVLGLYNVRSGHVDLLLRRAKVSECTRAGAPFFHLYLPAFGREAVPLNWVLSKDMTDYIWGAMVGESAREPTGISDTVKTHFRAYLDDNRKEMDRLLALLSATPPAQKPR